MAPRMHRALQITTPFQKGNDVRRAQLVLNGGNVWRTDFYRGDLDGEFGILSMQATKRAEFWCGFPTAQIDGAYGQRLDDFLTGAKPLPKAFAARRATRLKARNAAAKKRPLGGKALTRALRDVGKKEQPPNSNRMPGVTDWYAVVGPWCMMQVSRWFSDVGSIAFRAGARWAYVPFFLADAKQGVNGLSITKDPEPGDPVCFSWDGDSNPEHVGIFRRWVNRPAGKFEAVEGNTSLSSNSNGGEVMIRDRSTSQVAAFVRVGR